MVSAEDTTYDSYLMPSAYPELERYLKGQVWANRVRKLRRPEEWITWITIVGIGVFIGSGGSLLWALLMGILIQVIAYCSIGLRLRTFKAADMWAESMKQAFPGTVARLFKRRRLAERIGDDAMAMLEAYAKDAHVPTLAYVEAKMMVKPNSEAYCEVQRGAMLAADSLMNQELEVLRGSILFRSAPTAAEMAQLRVIGSQIHHLAIESIRASGMFSVQGESEQLRDSLAHLRAFEAAQAEVSGDIRPQV